MRPTAKRQSTLRAPLNAILRAEANVRLVRALTESTTPLSISELARRTRLHISGIAKALTTLEETGVVERVGAGSRRPARLRDEHPLASALRSLFEAERRRVDQVVDSLRRVAQGTYPVPIAAWVQGPVSSAEDGPDNPIVTVILTEPAYVEQARDAFETSLGDLESQLDVVIEVRVRTRADLLVASDEEREELRHAIPLAGPPPGALVDDPATADDSSARPARGHTHADARARALAGAIADRLRTDPSLVTRARDWVNDRLTTASSGERRELREWARILRTMSVPKLRRFLTDPGERATRLRQTLPFTRALSADERKQLLDAISARWESRETS